MQDMFMTSHQANRKKLIFKANGFEIVPHWGPVIQ